MAGRDKTTPSGSHTTKCLYYPFSRSFSDTALKRACLLYDEVVFIDPKSERVRNNLYSAANHSDYLPDNAAQRLELQWTEIVAHYDALVRAGVVSFYDPGEIVGDPGFAEVIAGNLQREAAAPGFLRLFDEVDDKKWSILRSRIPMACFDVIQHQFTQRVLYEENLSGNWDMILFADGAPDASFGQSVVKEREYACVMPYYAGASIAVSTAMLAADKLGATPFTDHEAAYSCMVSRLKHADQVRRSDLYADLSRLSGHAPVALPKVDMVERRLFDPLPQLEGPGTSVADGLPSPPRADRRCARRRPRTDRQAGRDPGG